MATLTRAHQELFRRSPDECFASLDDLYSQCADDHIASDDLWSRPQDLTLTHDMTVCLDGSDEFQLNDWSFSQLCRMAGVSKDTLNRLTHKTASKVFEETLPRSDKPLQLLSTGEHIRSVHGVSYTRLWNIELLDLVKEYAGDFSPPQVAADNTSTGLYCGEQDMFAFLIDPTGWAEIDGEAFAPGFFLWNSEVGRRTLGIQTFWFQRVCANHIVWDAVEVAEFTRKHTARVRDGLDEIRRIIEGLRDKCATRRDGFVRCMRKAMTERLGHDGDEVLKQLAQHGIPRQLIPQALQLAQAQGGFTIFAVVDALTRLSQSVQLAGDRAALDTKIGSLLALAA